MRHSLRGRLTFSYVAFVIALFVVVAFALAREAVAVYARSANDAIVAAGQQIREISLSHPGAGFEEIAADVHRSVERPGLRIVGFEPPPGVRLERPPFHVPDGVRGLYVKLKPGPNALAPPPGSDPNGSFRDDYSSLDRALFSIANLAGIRPERVETRAGVFFVGSDINRLRSILTWYTISMLAGLVLFGTLGWLIGTILAGQALAPMIAVTGALQRFAGGDFTPQSVDTRDRSEVGELASAFNGAAAQVASAFAERRRVEEYIRQFVADASHELRTPLTVIRGYLDVLKRGALNDPQKRERAFETLDIESRRMRLLIDKLIVLARLERPESSVLERVDVASVARNVAATFDAAPEHRPIALELEDGAHVMAEESEIHEALANLLDNARKYGGGSTVRLAIAREGAFVVARVIDAGPGISAIEQEHVFDRFYRGESRGEVEGSGLGLSIAQQAVSRAHGTLRLAESRPGRTVFEIKLPAAPHHGVPADASELVLR